jgi:hypothetical protein
MLRNYRSQDRARPWGYLRIAWAFLVLSLISVTAEAQRMPIPVRVQVPIFLKTLTFDRNYQGEDDTLVIGVLFQGRVRSSVDAKDEFVAVFEESPKSVEGCPIRIEPIDLSETPDLKTEVVLHKVRVLYVAPLRAYDIEKISSVTRDLKVLTMSGVTDYVESTLSIGVGARGDHPSLLINLRSSKAEGTDLDPQLLQVARIIK